MWVISDSIRLFFKAIADVMLCMLVCVGLMYFFRPDPMAFFFAGMFYFRACEILISVRSDIVCQKTVVEKENAKT